MYKITKDLITPYGLPLWEHLFNMFQMSNMCFVSESKVLTIHVK